MEKEKILRQINALPQKSGLLVRYGEMAKDLQEVMRDDEIIQGVVTAYKKSISHMIKNGRMMRSFMAVTNKNIYVISRGRMLLNTVNIINDTIIIPRSSIVRIEKMELSSVLKLMYGGEIKIVTNTEQYDLYMGPYYEQYLPSDLSITEAIHNICVSCGEENVADAKFCSKCGAPMPEEVVSESLGHLCPSCGKKLEEEMLFCPYCGKSLPEEIEITKKLCSNCGYELPEEVNFCPQCGQTVADQPKENKEILICSQCGVPLEEEMKFCPYCGGEGIWKTIKENDQITEGD